MNLCHNPQLQSKKCPSHHSYSSNKNLNYMTRRFYPREDMRVRDHPQGISWSKSYIKWEKCKLLHSYETIWTKFHHKGDFIKFSYGKFMHCDSLHNCAGQFEEQLEYTMVHHSKGSIQNQHEVPEEFGYIFMVHDKGYFNITAHVNPASGFGITDDLVMEWFL